MTKRLKLDEVIDLLNRDDEDFSIANADADFDVASTTDEVEPIMRDGLDLEFVQEEIEEHDTASANPHGYKWTTKLTPITVGEFEEQVGPTFRVGNTPMSVFSHMFPATIVESIVKETNRYAHQEMGDEKFAKWQPIDSNEFNAYLGFNILMGLVRFPELEDYWKNDPYFNYPPISDKISRTRFRHISQFMHFVDNDVLPTRGEVGYDRLGKIKPIITGIADAIQAAYSPGKEVSVDEAMIPFQGRSSLKQFLPLKPIKRGIKVWSLADSNNGYIHRFDVYTGKGSGTEKDAGLGESVVLNLTSHLQGPCVL
ncbi:hypothetical protein EMCRGX_G010695 [Ephydatia muelleri]